MYRVISLVKRKPGLTPQQFRDYYETKHRVLSERFLNGHALSYERYYLSPMGGNSAEPVYDAVMHLCFPDRNAYERWMSAVGNEPGTANEFAEDERNFRGLEATLHFEARDSFSTLKPLAPGATIFRTVWFARHRPGMTHEECRAYYEHKHRLLGEYMVNGYAYNYDRHYLHKLAPDAPEPWYTFVMEMNFPSQAHFDQVTANIMADPTLARFVGEDEARYIDRGSAVHYAAELCASVLEPVPLAAAE
jgi:hypothetical protein